MILELNCLAFPEADLNEAALRRTLPRAVDQAFGVVELSCVAEEEYLCDTSTSDHA